MSETERAETLTSRSFVQVPEGECSLRYYIGKVNDSEYPSILAKNHLRSDSEKDTHTARKFWNRSVRDLLELLFRDWSEKHSAVPIAAVHDGYLALAIDSSSGQQNEMNYANIRDHSRTVRLLMKNPFHWAKAIGRALGVWETYSQVDMNRWIESGQALPPRKIVDIGQGSVVRMIAFALTNQCQTCVAIVDESQLKPAQDLLKNVRETLQTIKTQKPANSIGDRSVLLDALVNWLDSRVRVYGVHLAQSQAYQLNEPQDITKLFSNRYANSTMLEAERMRVHAQLHHALFEIEDYRQSDLLIINNAHDSAYDFDRMSLDIDTKGVQHIVGGKVANVPLIHVFDLSDKEQMHDLLQQQLGLTDFSWVQADSGTLNLLETRSLRAQTYGTSRDTISEASSGTARFSLNFANAPKDDSIASMFWYAQLSVEYFFRVLKYVKPCSTRWFVFLHAPTPNSAENVTRDIGMAGQPLVDKRFVMADGVEAHLRLQYLIQSQEDYATAWDLEVRVPVPHLTQPRQPAPATRIIHIDQWLYRRIQDDNPMAEKLKLADDWKKFTREGDWILQNEPVDQDIDRVYNAQVYSRLHQADIVHVIGLMPSIGISQDASERERILTPKQWENLADYLQHTFVVEDLMRDGQFQVRHLDLQTVVENKTNDSARSLGLLSNKNPLQVIWFVAHARLNNAPLLLPTYASRTAFDGDKPNKFVQHVMMVANEHDQWALNTALHHMCPYKYINLGKTPFIERYKAQSKSQGNVYSVLSTRVKFSNALKEAFRLHELLYGSEQVRDSNISNDENALALHQDRLIAALERHLRDCFKVKQIVSEPVERREKTEASFKQKIIDVQRTCLFVMDLTAISKPLNFWIFFRKVMETTLGNILVKNGVAADVNGVVKRSFVIVLVGTKYNSKWAKTDDWIGHKVDVQVCKMLGIDAKDLRSVAILERSNWPISSPTSVETSVTTVEPTISISAVPPSAPKTSRKSRPKVQEEEDVMQVVASPSVIITDVSLSTAMSLSPVASISSSSSSSSSSSAFDDFLSADVISSVRDMVQLSSSTIVDDEFTSKKPARKTNKDKAIDIRQNANSARERVQTLRDAVKLRYRYAKEAAKNDYYLTVHLKDQHKATKRLLNKWEKTINEEEERALNKLKYTAGVELLMRTIDDGAFFGSTKELIELKKFKTVETYGSNNFNIYLSPKRIYRSPLLATPPSHHASIDATVPGDDGARMSIATGLIDEQTQPRISVDPTAEQVTIGDKMLHLFAQAAIGDICSRYTEQYAALFVDITGILTFLENVLGKSAKARKDVDKVEQRKQRAILAIQKKIIDVQNTLAENVSKAFVARQELREITGQDVSYANFFLYRIVTTLNSFMRSNEGATMPNDDQLVAIGKLLEEEYTRLWNNTRSIRNAMSNVVSKKASIRMTYIKAIGEVNEALGYKKDGSLVISNLVDVDEDGNRIEHPTKVNMWLDTSYSFYENASAPERLSMNPTSLAAMVTRVLDGYQELVEDELVPRMSNYIERMQVGAASAILTMRSVVDVYLNWAEQVLNQETAVRNLEVVQNPITSELAKWLASQHMQWFLDASPMKINERLVEHKWSWLDLEDAQETIEHEGVGDESSKLDVSTEDKQQGEEEDDSDVISYPEFEELHQEIWFTDFDSEEPYKDKITTAFMRIMRNALGSNEMPAKRYQMERSDDEEMDDTQSEDDDDEEEDEDGDESIELSSEEESSEQSPKKSNRASVTPKSPALKQKGPKVLSPNDPQSMQMRSAEEHSIAKYELDPTVYNFMAESFAKASTRDNPNRWVFRPRNGFEFLTLAMWREYGSVFLDHFKRGRAFELNVKDQRATIVRERNEDVVRSAEVAKFDVTMIYPIFTDYLDDQALRAEKLSGSSQFFLELRDLKRQENTRESVAFSANVSREQIEAELLANGIVKDLLKYVWDSPVDLNASSSSVNVVSARNLQKKVDLNEFKRRCVENVALQISLRRIIIVSAISKLYQHSVFPALFRAYYNSTEQDIGSEELNRFIRLVITSVPSNVENERQAGAISRFHNYFMETSMKPDTLAMQFWETLLDEKTVGNADGSSNSLISLESAIRKQIQDRLIAINKDSASEKPVLVSKTIKVFDEDYSALDNYEQLTDVLQLFIKTRVERMVTSMTECCVQEFLTHSLFAHAFYNGEPQDINDTNSMHGNAKREIALQYPRGLIAQKFNVSSSGSAGFVSDNVRLENPEEEQRIRARIVSEKEMQTMDIARLIELISSVVNHLALNQRDEDEEEKSMKAFAIETIEESNGLESRMWGTVSVLAALRILHWSALQSIKTDVTQGAVFRWIYQYSFSKEKEKSIKQDDTPTDLLKIMHIFWRMLLIGSSDIHIHEAFQWWNTTNKARPHVLVSRLVLPYEEFGASSQRAQNTSQHNAGAVFTLALPRQCDAMEEDLQTMHIMPTPWNRDAKLAPVFVANTWQSLYDMFQLHATQAFKRVLVLNQRKLTEVNDVRKSIEEDSDEEYDMDDVPKKVEPGDKQLKNFSYARASYGALFVDYNTGKALEYIPRKQESPVNLEKYFERSSSSSKSQEPIASVTNPMSVVASASILPQSISSTSDVAQKPVNVLQPRKRPLSDVQDEGAKRVRSTAPPVLDIAGQVDVTATAMNVAAKLPSTSSDSSAAIQISQICDTILPHVTKDQELLQEFNKNGPIRQSTVVQTLAVSNIERSTNLLETPKKVSVSTAPSVLAADLFHELMGEIDVAHLGSQCTDDVAERIVVAMDDLNTKYKNDPIRVLKCIAEACDDFNPEIPVIVKIKLKALAGTKVARF